MASPMNRTDVEWSGCQANMDVVQGECCVEARVEWRDCGGVDGEHAVSPTPAHGHPRS